MAVNSILYNNFVTVGWIVLIFDTAWWMYDAMNGCINQKIHYRLFAVFFYFKGWYGLCKIEFSTTFAQGSLGKVGEKQSIMNLSM